MVKKRGFDGTGSSKIGSGGPLYSGREITAVT